jgi:SAM-dependent methyltransferase
MPSPLLADYWMDLENVRNYLSKAARLPHRRAGDAALIQATPLNVNRILDLGTGDGHLIALLMQSHPNAQFVGVDISMHMLAAAKTRFRGNPQVTIFQHDLNQSLDRLGKFDVVVSSLATHHLTSSGMARLYAEIFELLGTGGVFCNLDHVAASTEQEHYFFYDLLGDAADCFDDIRSKPLPISQHLRLLREIEFSDVACRWEWFEMALLVASRAPLVESTTPRPSYASPDPLSIAE